MFDKFIYLTESACSLGYTAGFSILSFEIRWYALSYILGILLGQKYINYIIKLNFSKTFITSELIDKFLIWAILGILVGGRIGYITFYNIEYYFNNPFKIFYLWEGGMSFHGGVIGIVISIFLFSTKNNIKFLSLTDLIATAAPIGIFLGRISNFLNGELWGRASEMPWAVKFSKCGGNIYRHPSQLYEAILEGVILFIILYFCITKFKHLENPGKITGLFCIFYALFRIISELYREPDFQIGFILANLTMGMLLSIPLLIIGLYLIGHNKREKN
mgnify:FL=1